MPPLLAKATILPTRLGFPSKIKSWLVGTDNSGLSRSGESTQGSSAKPCSLLAHLICPVFKSNARSVSKNRHRSAFRGRVAVLSIFHTCGRGVVVFSTDEERTRRWGSIRAVCQTALHCIPPGFPPCQAVESLPEHRQPVFTSSATTLPRKLQHGYVGSVC